MGSITPPSKLVKNFLQSFLGKLYGAEFEGVMVDREVQKNNFHWMRKSLLTADMIGDILFQ
jgi:hypothetical protein